MNRLSGRRFADVFVDESVTFRENYLVDLFENGIDCFTNNTGHGHIILLQLDHRKSALLVYTRDNACVNMYGSILDVHEAASWSD